MSADRCRAVAAAPSTRLHDRRRRRRAEVFSGDVDAARTKAGDPQRCPLGLQEQIRGRQRRRTRHGCAAIARRDRPSKRGNALKVLDVREPVIWTVGRNLRGLVVTIRPREWSKNLLVFSSLIFSKSLTDAANLE